MVVDASAVLTLLEVPAPTADDPLPRYLDLIELFEPVAPGLIAWELGNVIHHKEPQSFGRDSEERATRLQRVLLDISRDTPSPSDLARTGRLAEALGLSFYDAAYLELAERDGTATLLTDDDRLWKAASGLLGHDRVYRSHDPDHSSTP